MPATAARRSAPRRPAATPPSASPVRLLAAAVTGAAIAAIVTAVLLAPPTGEDEVAARAAAIALEFEERDAATLADLTSRVDAAGEVVAAALSALHGLDAGADVSASGRAARAALADGGTPFADRPSAGTTINLARESFDLATAQAVAAADLAAAGSPADDVRAAVALAVRTWSIGASLLDLAHIEAGNGHHHAFLPLQVPGAMAADS